MKKPPFLTSLCLSVVFCLASVAQSPAQSFTRLVKLNGANGEGPAYGSLIQGIDGNFYGTTNLGGAKNGGEVFKITPNGKVSTLYSFCPGVGCLDGSLPSDARYRRSMEISTGRPRKAVQATTARFSS